MLRAERLGKAGTFSKAFSSELLLPVSSEFDTSGEPEVLDFSRVDVSVSSGIASTSTSGSGTVALSYRSPLGHGAKSRRETFLSSVFTPYISVHRICFKQFNFYQVIILTGAYVVSQKHRARPRQPRRQRFPIRRPPIKTKKQFVRSSICTRTQERPNRMQRIRQYSFPRVNRKVVRF